MTYLRWNGNVLAVRISGSAASSLMPYVPEMWLSFSADGGRLKGGFSAFTRTCFLRTGNGTMSRRRVSVKELGQPDHQGWLYRKKESKGFLGIKWKKYWFVLKKTALYWYANQLVSTTPFHQGDPVMMYTCSTVCVCVCVSHSYETAVTAHHCSSTNLCSQVLRLSQIQICF